MPDITVQRHGERWAVIPAGAESAAEEHETREAAEMSARGLAAGGRVEVREDDPTNLDEAPETTRQSDSPTVGGVTADHLTRSQQSGT